jgi:cell division protease FtsH
LGVVTFEKERRPMFLETGFGYDTGRAISEDTARAIDSEVRKMVQKAYTLAREILEAHQQQMKTLARHLLEKEVVEGEELRRILGEVPPIT